MTAYEIAFSSTKTQIYFSKDLLNYFQYRATFTDVSIQ